MGEVFCAQDLKLGRNVAIKILPAEFADDQKRLGRFLREARLASNLSHPNITHIYEIGEENGIHFIAMEYVEGTTLQEKIKDGPLDSPTMIKIAKQIGEALETAHSAGIVHRDVKPANIMLTSADHVKILDFGLAKKDWDERPDIDVVSTEAFTQTGAILGTVYYMSPEQALGKRVDQRSDIFSFGEVLYEMATGKRAFQGPNATATIAQILASQPQPAKELNPNVSANLNRVIERSLRKDPQQRYQTIKDLMQDLTSQENAFAASPGLQAETEREYSLPRGLARAFFIAVQCMYLVFYLCALRWNEAMENSFSQLLSASVAEYLTLGYIWTAILGMAIRIHLMFLVLWDHRSAGVQFRKVFFLIFALDAFWAFAPFGLLSKVSGVLLMACVPPLAFSPISQRTLIRTAYDLHANRRT